ncbi:serine/threonine-protein kinase [Risungbinella massiliensis]|uniref:serine/threonine-protein kinase n=1 Tax=Risungbinella massiliensis TaxID=1329796 RepID=UPI00069BF242|nr:serine/threonine-protein kinase [Risungbinella massiliensis]
MSATMQKVLSNRYELHHQIGTGGMAAVYQGLDRHLNRPIAIKLLQVERSKDDQWSVRMRREAETLAKLRHDHVVEVYDADLDQDQSFFVMELLSGPTLKEYIQQQGPLPFHEIKEIATQILKGLSYAHQQGVLHRDIKPHNILGTRIHSWKLTDFGICKLISDHTQERSATNGGIFSVSYASPEQILGREITYASDLYSLGVVLYEMATGRVPFEGELNIAVAMKHVQEEVPDMRLLRPDIPEELYQIIWKALRKSPESRYQRALDMIKDIEAWHVKEEIPWEWNKETQLNGTSKQTIEEEIQPKNVTEQESSEPKESRRVQFARWRKKWGKKALYLVGGFILVVIIGTFANQLGAKSEMEKLVDKYGEDPKYRQQINLVSQNSNATTITNTTVTRYDQNHVMYLENGVRFLQYGDGCYQTEKKNKIDCDQKPISSLVELSSLLPGILESRENGKLEKKDTRQIVTYQFTEKDSSMKEIWEKLRVNKKGKNLSMRVTATFHFYPNQPTQEPIYYQVDITFESEVPEDYSYLRLDTTIQEWKESLPPLTSF